MPIQADKEWQVALRSGCVLAAAVGVGRFVFTPVVPLMQSQAGLTVQEGATMATANYAGYLAGALATMVVPRWGRSVLAVRISTVSVVASLALMPLAASPAAWNLLRGLAGAGSAVMFVAAAGAVLTGVSRRSRHLVGWAYGGVGAGIALSGATVLLVDRVGDWRAAWWAAAGLAAALSTAGWHLVRPTPPDAPPVPGRVRRPNRRFVPLVLAYGLEGLGYIVAGTFLVAAVAAAVPGSVAQATWVVVGLAAVPSCVLWAWLSSRTSHATLLTAALGLQAVGIAVAGLGLGVAGAVVAALLFGGTFMGVTTLALDAGRHLQIPAAVAMLSATYAVGQMAGPVLVAPLLTGGFRTALVVAGGIVALAAVAASRLRVAVPRAGHAPAPGREPALHH